MGSRFRSFGAPPKELYVDLNTIAFRTVQTAIGERRGKSRQKVEAGKLGGKARARALTPAKRRKIALKANRTRWNGRRGRR